jgi:multiple sugar transport system ATP-binding protein
MNLIDARLERGPEVVFGPHRLRIPATVLAEHPGLDRYLGREIVLGIRPEHVADASLAPLASLAGGGSVIDLPIRLREELGSEVHVHGAIGEASHVGANGSDDVHSLATLVARMDPRTSIAVGETARLRVDVDRLHFFDGGSGQSIMR